MRGTVKQLQLHITQPATRCRYAESHDTRCVPAQWRGSRVCAPRASTSCPRPGCGAGRSSAPPCGCRRRTWTTSWRTRPSPASRSSSSSRSSSQTTRTAEFLKNPSGARLYLPCKNNLTLQQNPDFREMKVHPPLTCRVSSTLAAPLRTYRLPSVRAVTQLCCSEICPF